MAEIEKLNHKQLAEVIYLTYHAKEPLMIYGPMGIGD